MNPRAPALHTAATSSGVSPPPAKGAWKIGCASPSRCARGVMVVIRLYQQNGRETGTGRAISEPLPREEVNASGVARATTTTWKIAATYGEPRASSCLSVHRGRRAGYLQQLDQLIEKLVFAGSRFEQDTYVMLLDDLSSVV